jgi:hypothetical protein
MNAAVSQQHADSVLAARARYFADNGFSDAGYTDPWVKLKVGPIPVWFPNGKSRQRAIPLHDLHHVATGYATSWTGEAEISAWEIGGGCTDYWAAWVINLGGFAVGLALAPRRVFRAFVRGRRSRNLYRDGWSDALLRLSVPELRARMNLDADPSPPRASDFAAFTGWIVTLAAGPLALATVLFAAT